MKKAGKLEGNGRKPSDCIREMRRVTGNKSDRIKETDILNFGFLIQYGIVPGSIISFLPA